MRTTLALDDDLLEKATALTGVAEKSALVREALRALIQRESAQRPQATMATGSEVLGFIDQATLAGSGIGYIDAHLLAAVRLTPGTQLWTRDKRLLAAGVRLGVAYVAAH